MLDSDKFSNSLAVSDSFGSQNNNSSSYKGDVPSIDTNQENVIVREFENQRLN